MSKDKLGKSGKHAGSHDAGKSFGQKNEQGQTSGKFGQEKGGQESGKSASSSVGNGQAKEE